MVVYTLEQCWAKWACDRLTKMPILAKEIIFLDEAHFDLGGRVNKQNCRIWGTENRTHILKSRRTQNESFIVERIFVHKN